MQILDKNKDYYDYFSHIYGADKSITFDRRGSFIITDEIIFSLSQESHRKMYYNSDFFDSHFYILLETGNVQYLIKCFNFKFITKNVLIDKFDSCSMELINTFKENKHYFELPISIRYADVNTHYKHKIGYVPILKGSYQQVIYKASNLSIDLPILKDSQLTSMIDAKEIWIELQNYISSLDNDKDITIQMTDVEKAVNHGFDKKTSFRNPIK